MSIQNLPATFHSSKDIEAQALTIFRKEWAAFFEFGSDPCEFTDDLAIEILVEHGIPTCRLACDIQMLVGQAYWQAKEASHAVRR